MTLEQKSAQTKSMIDSTCTDITYDKKQSFYGKVESDIIVTKRQAL